MSSKPKRVTVKIIRAARGVPYGYAELSCGHSRILAHDTKLKKGSVTYCKLRHGK